MSHQTNTPTPKKPFNQIDWIRCFIGDKSVFPELTDAQKEWLAWHEAYHKIIMK